MALIKHPEPAEIFVPSAMLCVNIPMDPPSELNPNARVHRGRVTRMKRKFRDDAYLATYNLIHDPSLAWSDHAFPVGESLDVSILIGWSPTRQEMDRDNIIASCKACLDGVSRAIKHDDKFFNITGADQVRDAAGRGWTRIVIRTVEKANGEETKNHD